MIMPRKFEKATFSVQETLDFHSQGKPGKLESTPTKPMATQRELSLAYSPRVAVPVERIAADPKTAYDYTNCSTLVAVIANGTLFSGSAISAHSPPSRCWKARR